MLGRLAGEEEPVEVDQDSRVDVASPLKLTAIDSADDTIALAWSRSASARGFNVYRAARADGDYVRLNLAPIAGNSYADSGLTPETAYFYAVTALGSEGESERAGPVRVATGSVAPPCDPYFADNFTHTLRGRAYALFGLTYAWGSNDPMGWWNIYTETNLYRDGGRYRVGTCPKNL
jgi:hypothetical protein